jgi:hypothetical protein
MEAMIARINPIDPVTTSEKLTDNNNNNPSSCAQLPIGSLHWHVAD